MTLHSYLPTGQDRPLILTISASDALSLAGSQMDLRCATSLGVHCGQAITATTVQNNTEFYSMNPVTAESLAAQIDLVLALKPQAIKIGLIADLAQMHVIADRLSQVQCPIVYDPVLHTSSGYSTLTSDMSAAMNSTLMPLVSVLTINQPDAERLLGVSLTESRQWRLGADRLLRITGAGKGPSWVVIKGGHSDSKQAVDYCVSDNFDFSLASTKIATSNTRGTGCAFATFIASALAKGYEPQDALVIAKMAMQAGLACATTINHYAGCVQATGFPYNHWPTLVDYRLPSIETPGCFVSETQALGLYPIVDNVSSLAQLLPLGIGVAQFRVKRPADNALTEEIRRAIALARDYHCKLYINDHWQLAIEQGAYGVHLGQSDLASADIHRIAQAGLRLGISSHCHWEVARAKCFSPSYLACGPVFATQTKTMPWVPHGVAGLRYWVTALSDETLVAIGGINLSNVASVAATGVSGLALIQGISAARHPVRSARHMMEVIKSHRQTDGVGGLASVG